MKRGRRKIARITSVLLVMLVLMVTIMEGFAETNGEHQEKVPSKKVAEELNVSNEIIYNEGHTSAEIRLDLSKIDLNRIRIISIKGPEGSDLDIDNPKVLVKENGEYKFEINYSFQGQLEDEENPNEIEKKEILASVEEIAVLTDDNAAENENAPEMTGEISEEENAELQVERGLPQEVFADGVGETSRGVLVFGADFFGMGIDVYNRAEDLSIGVYYLASEKNSEFVFPDNLSNIHLSSQKRTMYIWEAVTEFKNVLQRAEAYSWPKGNTFYLKDVEIQVPNRGIDRLSDEGMQNTTVASFPGWHEYTVRMDLNTRPILATTYNSYDALFAACKGIVNITLTVDGRQSFGNYELVRLLTGVNEISTEKIIDVTYNANGGTIDGESSKTVEMKWGDTYGTMPEPKRDNYKFIGWFTEQNGGTKINPNDQPLGNTILYAHWGTETYTLTYTTANWEKEILEITGGTVPVDKTEYKFGDEPIIQGDVGNLKAVWKRNNPGDKPGQKFVLSGWDRSSKLWSMVEYPLSEIDKGTVKYHTSGDSGGIRKDGTLYARWALAYDLKYDANWPENIETEKKSGDVPAMQEYIRTGTSPSIAGNTRKLAVTDNSYVFLGWSRDKNAAKPEYKAGATYNSVGDSGGITENGTLYAVWEHKTIKFYLEYMVSSSNFIHWWKDYTKPYYVIPDVQIGDLGERLVIQNPIVVNNPYNRKKPFLITMNSYKTPDSLAMLEFTGWSRNPGPNTGEQAKFDNPEYTVAEIAAGKARYDTKGESGGITSNGKLYARYKEITFSVSYDPNLPQGATQVGEVPVDTQNYQFATKATVKGNTQGLSAKKDKTTYQLIGWNRTRLEPLESGADANIDYKIEDCNAGNALYETKGTEDIYHLKDVDDRSNSKGGITSDGTLYAVWQVKNNDQISFEQEMIKLSNISGKVTVKSLPKLIINGVDATSEQMAGLTYKYEKYERSGKSGAYTYGWSNALKEGTDDDAIALLPIIVNKPESNGTLISASTTDNMSGIVRLTVGYNGQEASCIIIIPGDVNLDKRLSVGDLEKLEAYVYGEAEPVDYEYQTLMSVLRNDSVSQTAFPSIRDLELLENLIY